MNDPQLRGLVQFVHGKESGPYGRKIKAMMETAEQSGWRTESLDYSFTADPAVRLKKLDAALCNHEGPLVLAGSSMGGWIALEAARRAETIGVFLLAPALAMPHYPTPGTPASAPTEIIHGWADDVVPAEHSIKFARTNNCHLHLLPSGHRLDDQIPTICQLFQHFLNRLVE